MNLKMVCIKLDKLDEAMVKIGISTNYNIEGERVIKNTKLSNGTENRINVENFCYQNILKKLEILFLKSKKYH